MEQSSSASPLMAMADLHICEILDACEGGIKDIVIEDILGVLGFLLCLQQGSQE